ncbi:MAG TPA: ribonuclease P protein component [Candidatus Saccharimonadales bacterium]|nr:ribonuclease P protein component [Candidatus Saccharimonadales bacterium]
MLPKKFRLPSQIKFIHPRSVFTPLFTVKIVQNNLDYSRFGVIVSKKIDKRAVVRNSIKRKIRSCITKDNWEKKGQDVLFIVKPDAKKEEPSLRNKAEEVLKNL